MIEQYKGMLEIDRKRGVIYFHSEDAEVVKQMGTQTILRIVGFYLTKTKPNTPLDLNPGMIAALEENR